MRNFVMPLSLLMALVIGVGGVAAQKLAPDFTLGEFGVTDSFRVWFEVSNVGTAPYKGPLWFKLWDGTKLIEEWSDEVELPKGATTKIVSNYSLAYNATWARGRVKVLVDSKNLVPESNERNNEKFQLLTVPLVVTSLSFEPFRKSFRLAADKSKVERVPIPFTARRVAGNVDVSNVTFSVVDGQFGGDGPIGSAVCFVSSAVPVISATYQFAATSGRIKPRTPGKHSFELLVTVDGQTDVSLKIPYVVEVFGGYIERTQSTMARLTVGTPTAIPSGEKACPYFYLPSPDGASFVKHGELIRDLVGPAAQSLERTVLTAPVVLDGVISMLIREEKDEVTYLDYVALEIGGRVFLPQVAGETHGALSARDGEYLVLEKGHEVRLDFEVGGAAAAGEIVVLADGFYEPIAAPTSASVERGGRRTRAK